MKAISKVLSCASIAAVAASSTVPAFAYFESESLPGYVQNVNQKNTGRAVTSRELRNNRDQNRPVIGETRTDEAMRSASEGSMGQAYDVRPVRGEWRRPGLRGERRRMTAGMRGGEYRVLPVDSNEESSAEETVTEGKSMSHPNWRSWARGRTAGMRNLNGMNRHDYK